jgi:hypothetical protein
MHRIGLLFLFGLLSLDVSGQQIEPDTTLLKKSTQYALARYQQSERGNDRLYNGFEHTGYDPRLKGDPYFEVKDFQPGTLQFDGREFTAVPMLYDLVRDVVTVEHEAGFRVSLRPDKLPSFSFRNHQFIRLIDSTTLHLSPGFYDLLYNGPTQLLAKRVKKIAINSSVSQGVGQFEYKVTYYIRRNGLYQPIKNGRTLLASLEDRKKELAAYIKAQKLRFKPDPEPAIVAVARYYDELGK